MSTRLIFACILSLFRVEAMPQSSPVVSSVSATFSAPNDTLSATWTDSPSDGRQWWSVFNTSGQKIITGILASSSTGKYSVTVTFLAPANGKIMFQVCNAAACKDGQFFIPSSASPPSSFLTKFTEINVTADSLVALPWTCRIPEFLTTTDSIAASAAANSAAISEAIDEESQEDDSVSVKIDAQCAMSENVASNDSLGFAFTVLFPQGCTISVSGQAATCSTP